MEVLDAGRAYAGGRPPDDDPVRRRGSRRTSARTSRRRPSSAPSRRHGSWSGCARRARPGRSGATRSGTLDWRADPQNLPAGLAQAVAGRGLRLLRRRGDYGTAYIERGEIYDTVRDGRHHRIRHRLGRPAQLLGGPRREGACRRARSSRSAPRSSPARSPRRAWSRRSSIASPRTTRCARCTLADGRRASRSPPSTCCCTTACGRASSTSARATCERARRASNPDLAPHLSFRGHGRPRLRDVARRGRRGRVRVRLHPAAARAQRGRRRRAAALSRRRTACRCGARASGRASSSACIEGDPETAL